MQNERRATFSWPTLYIYTHTHELRHTDTRCLVVLSTNFVLQCLILLHIEELNDLYCSPNIVHVIKSRRMRWAGHVAYEGEERRIQGFGGET